MKNLHRLVGIVIMGAVMLGASGKLWAQASTPKSAGDEISPWYVGLGGGYIKLEGDEATKGNGFIQLKLGYDYTPRWSFEGSLLVFPYEKKNDVIDDYPEPHPRPGLDGDSTWAVGLAADALLHLNASDNRHWDPYLMAGLGATYFQRERADAWHVDPIIRYGVGLAYHFNPEWSVHVDFDCQTAIHKERDALEFNMMPSAGLSWKWGAHAPAGAIAAGGLPAAKASPAEPVEAAVPPEPQPVDLRMFELDMNYAEGKWHEYFSELDAIAKIVQAHPDAEILIEGHIDQQPNVSDRDARKLTEKRAEDIRDYFVKNHAIARKRITVVGYGFSRPKAPNDPVNGNPENRRMVIHIRAAQKAP